MLARASTYRRHVTAGALACPPWKAAQVNMEGPLLLAETCLVSAPSQDLQTDAKRSKKAWKE